MNIFSNLKIRTKLGIGFGLMTLILAAVLIINIVQLKKTQFSTNRIVELRIPTSESSMSIQNGINHALAALRGWMLLGEDKFRVERAEVWRTEIYDPLNKMKELSTNWTNPENVKRLQEMVQLIADFDQYQQEIEDIANTPKNVPAMNILQNDVTPLINTLGANITKMIDLEGEQAATPERKAMLGMMADVRGTLGLGVGNLRAYLVGGEPKFKAAFEKLWAKNGRRFNDLTSQQALFSSEQKVAYQAFADARKKFVPYPDQLMKMRVSKDWNLANYWLATKAAPIGARISEILKGMVINQKKLLVVDAQGVKSKYENMIQLLWISLVVALLLSIIFSCTCVRMITVPLQEALAASLKIAEGDLDVTLEERGSDEIGLMIRANKSMVSKLNEVIYTIRSAADNINIGSREISSTAQQLSQGSSDQASSVEQVASSV